MEQEASEIFARAHRVYIKGVRAGFAECLQSAHGSDWSETVVMSALGDNQRENLERDREAPRPSEPAKPVLPQPAKSPDDLSFYWYIALGA